MTEVLSPTLLTPETSLVLLLDYQKHVMDGVHSGDQELIELNAKALARVSKAFKVPVVLSTIGVQLRGDPSTLPSIREELKDEKEYDRNTMNAWEDAPFRAAVDQTGRKRLIFAAIWTEVCLELPVLHAQRDGWETYFVADAVGGSSKLAHDTAVQRMIQAGSQPITVGSLMTEWVRDWAQSPHAQAGMEFVGWYEKQHQSLSQRQSMQHQQPLAA